APRGARSGRQRARGPLHPRPHGARVPRPLRAAGGRGGGRV
ncbi:MAG: hypothetical protein AVDCRST_MAG11-2461, partial [uncultured Gemmatimonadaceae bacterium]